MPSRRSSRSGASNGGGGFVFLLVGAAVAFFVTEIVPPVVDFTISALPWATATAGLATLVYWWAQRRRDADPQRGEVKGSRHRFDRVWRLLYGYWLAVPLLGLGWWLDGDGFWGSTVIIVGLAWWLLRATMSPRPKESGVASAAPVDAPRPQPDAALDDSSTTARQPLSLTSEPRRLEHYRRVQKCTSCDRPFDFTGHCGCS